MRVEVKLHGPRPDWLREGTRWTLGSTVSSNKDRRWIGGLQIEDPGWPDGTPIRVASLRDGAAVLEPDESSAAWRQSEGDSGLKGALARWALKHAGGDMQKGQTDMTGDIYEGLVVTTETVAAGPNSDKNVSKIVFTKGPFVARDDKTASGIVLAAAVKEHGVDPNDVEVRVRKWA